MPYGSARGQLYEIVDVGSGKLFTSKKLLDKLNGCAFFWGNLSCFWSCILYVVGVSYELN